MERLWTLYHPEIPAFLREFADTPPMARLRDVGMNCGCQYTRFPRFAEISPYSRHDHSVGVALIVWHFTGSMEQSLAGLFHDIATPVFAHVVDFLNGDYMHQETTEAGTRECIEGSPEITALLGRYGLTVEQVADYHRYPVADNGAPALSADRLEYTLGNLLNFGFADAEQIKDFYRDLTLGTNEADRPELAFQTPETAAAFTRCALRNSRVYVADEDRFAMEMLANLLRLALGRGVLSRKDLWSTETAVIRRLQTDMVCGAEWDRFCGYSRLLREAEKLEDGYWVQVNAKKRWIDPLVLGKGRVSDWDEEARGEIRDFLELDFSGWLSAE